MRVELLRLQLARRQLSPDGFALPALAAAADGFSGAEMKQAIVSALYAAHAAQRPLDTDLLMQQIRGTRPLSVIMADRSARCANGPASGRCRRTRLVKAPITRWPRMCCTMHRH